MKRMEGVTMSKLAIAVAALALVIGGGAFASGIDGGGDDRRATTSTTTTGTTTTDDRADDHGRRGQKARHARKAKMAKRNANVRERRHGFREPGEDVRGPCDEAEHASDPRCTGAAVDDDSSGPGSRRNDDSGRGRSGSNSGRG
jgi:hypothetical protein